eukprot:sb/3473488/
MVKEQLLECGANSGLGAGACPNRNCFKATGHTEDGPICEVIKFSTQFSGEILRDLLLPEQRFRIHEAAARVLQSRILGYEFCCKKEFFGNVFKISELGQIRPDGWQKARDNSEAQGCQCHHMFTTIYPQIIRHYKEAHAKHKRSLAQKRV